MTTYAQSATPTCSKKPNDSSLNKNTDSELMDEILILKERVEEFESALNEKSQTIANLEAELS